MPVCLGTDRTGTIEFRLLSKDRIEDALTVQWQSMRQECIAIGVGMFEDPGAPEEMQLVFREVIKDGCTVIAVDRSDHVVAVAFNKLHASIALHRRLMLDQSRGLLKYFDNVEIIQSLISTSLHILLYIDTH